MEHISEKNGFINFEHGTAQFKITSTKIYQNNTLLTSADEFRQSSLSARHASVHFNAERNLNIPPQIVEKLNDGMECQTRYTPQWIVSCIWADQKSPPSTPPKPLLDEFPTEEGGETSKAVRDKTNANCENLVFD